MRFEVQRAWAALAAAVVAGSVSAQLVSIVDNVRVSRPDATILLGAYAELQRTGPTTYRWSTYVSKIGDTAVTKGVALMDLRRHVPPATAARIGTC